MCQIQIQMQIWLYRQEEYVGISDRELYTDLNKQTLYLELTSSVQINGLLFFGT